MDEDSPESHNLTLTEAVNMAQNRLLWRLLVVSGATHSIVVQARNDDDDDLPCTQCNYPCRDGQAELTYVAGYILRCFTSQQIGYPCVYKPDQLQQLS